MRLRVKLSPIFVTACFLLASTAPAVAATEAPNGLCPSDDTGGQGFIYAGPLRVDEQEAAGIWGEQGPTLADSDGDGLICGIFEDLARGPMALMDDLEEPCCATLYPAGVPYSTTYRRDRTSCVVDIGYRVFNDSPAPAYSVGLEATHDYSRVLASSTRKAPIQPGEYAWLNLRVTLPLGRSALILRAYDRVEEFPVVYGYPGEGSFFSTWTNWGANHWSYLDHTCS